MSPYIIFVLALSICGASAQDPVLYISSAILPTGLRSMSAIYDGDDAIYILGGYNGTYYVSDILKFTISTEKMETVGHLPEERSSGTAIWDGTGIIYFGGNTGSGLTDSIRRYIPGKSVTNPAEYLPSINYHSVAVSINNYGGALIFGGESNGKRIVKYENNLAQEIPNSRLPMQIFGAAAIHYQNENENLVYLFGGNSEDILDTVISYNIANERSSVLTQYLPNPLRYSSAVFNGTYAFIIGGESPDHVTGVTRFNPLTKEMTSLTVNNFPNQLYRTSVVYVDKVKKAFIFGGSSEGIETRNQIMYLVF